MSYDIYLTDKKGETLHLDTPHFVTGGTYMLGGTTECWLNITYNYAESYYTVFGTKGIRILYGMTGQKSISIIKDAIEELGDECSSNYWEALEGNAKAALRNLLFFAEARPNGIWKGD